MSIKTILLMIGIVIAVSFFAGCAKVPQADIDAANTAMSAAKEAEADRYLPEEFKAVQDSHNAAMTEIENQKSKFALTRNFKNAATLLQDATKKANELKEKVAPRKEEVKAEVQKLMTDVKAAQAEAKSLMKKAPKGKEGRAALQAIQIELNAAETSLSEVPTLINNGDFLTAKDKASAALQKVQSINQELKQAIAKRSGVKR